MNTPVILLKAFAVNARPEPSLQHPPLFVVYAPIRDARRVWTAASGWIGVERGEQNPFYMSERFTQRADPSALIDAPWVSQLGADAPGAFDCGQACVLMLLRYYGKATANLTVQRLTDIAPGRTNAVSLKRLAALYGLTLIDILDGRSGIERAVRHGRPVIALVNYRDLDISPAQNPASRTDPGLHWIVLTGYADGWFYVHDPLWMAAARAGAGGAYVPVHETALWRAWRGTALK